MFYHPDTPWLRRPPPPRESPLARANEEDDIWRELSHAVYVKKHGGNEAPNGAILTSDLAIDWIPECPAKYIEETESLLNDTIFGYTWKLSTKWRGFRDDDPRSGSPMVCALGFNSTGRLVSVGRVVGIHQHWWHKPIKLRGPYPLAPIARAYQNRTPSWNTAYVKVTYADLGMGRRYELHSTVSRTPWEDAEVAATVVESQPFATLQPRPVLKFRNRGSEGVLHILKPSPQAELKLSGMSAIPCDLRLAALRAVPRDGSFSLPGDVHTLLTYANALTRPTVLHEREAAMLLARHRYNKEKGWKGGEFRTPVDSDIHRVWEVAYWLRELVVWDTRTGRWLPLAFVDVLDLDRLVIGPPEWARSPRPGKWTLTAEGSASAVGRSTAGEGSMAGRILTGIEYRLAAEYDGHPTSRLARYLRPERGRSGPGPNLAIPWRVVMMLAGEHWDRSDARSDKRHLSRYNRAFDIIEKRGYRIPEGRWRNPAPAGDSIEIVDRIRGSRSQSAGIVVRATARFTEAARLAQMPEGRGFEHRPFIEWAGVRKGPYPIDKRTVSH